MQIRILNAETAEFQFNRVKKILQLIIKYQIPVIQDSGHTKSHFSAAAVFPVFKMYNF